MLRIHVFINHLQVGQTVFLRLDLRLDHEHLLALSPPFCLSSEVLCDIFLLVPHQGLKFRHIHLSLCPMHQLVQPFFLESLVSINFEAEIVTFGVQVLLCVLWLEHRRPYFFMGTQVGVLTGAFMATIRLLRLAVDLQMHLVLVLVRFDALLLDDFLYGLD